MTTQKIEQNALEVIRSAIDPEYYYAQVEAPLEPGACAAQHYLSSGAAAGLNPTRGFSTERYLGSHPQLLEQGANPFHHYLTTEQDEQVVGPSYPERRSMRGLAARHFDTDYYLTKYTDVEDAAAEPLHHFLTLGWQEGRNPTPWFDTEQYIAEYGELIGDDQNPFMHYLETRFAQGLSPLPDNSAGDVPVDTVRRAVVSRGAESSPWSTHIRTALANYGLVRRDDLDRAINMPTLAFLETYGASDGSLSGWLATDEVVADGEQVNLLIDDVPVAVCKTVRNRADIVDHFGYPHVLGFSFKEPGCDNPDDADSRTDQRKHFSVSIAGKSGPAFAVNGVNLDAAKHAFLTAQLSFKLKQRLVVSNEIQRAKQLSAIAECIEVGFYSAKAKISFNDAIEAATHYFDIGAEAGLDPACWFNTLDYSARVEFRDPLCNPFYHYLAIGRVEGLAPSDDGPLDRRLAATDPLLALRNLFDEEFYVAKYPDLIGAPIEPFDHFMMHGWMENRDPCRRFSVAYYLEHNHDVRAAQVNPFEHYALQGWKEGRRPHPDHCRIDLDLSVDPRREHATLHLPRRTSVRKTLETRTSSLSLAVHIHAFHVDQIGSLLDRLESLPKDARLYLTTDTDAKRLSLESLYGERMAEYHSAEIFVVENVGRDVYPMLELLRRGIDDAELVLHVHTKKSDHLGEYAERWNQHIMDHLIGDEESVAAIIDYFATNPSCCLSYPVPPDEHSKYINWGDNRVLATQLFERIGLDSDLVDTSELDFPVGNMMWFKPDALAQLTNSDLSVDDFPAEPIDVDGTIAHALERCLPLIVKASGGDVVKTQAMSVANMPEKTARKPEISVVVPILNSAHWLHESIGSVLRQGPILSSVELVLVDNDSSDGSLEIAQHYARSFGNITCVSEPCRGAGNARNTGLALSRGRYLMFLDADDVLADGSLESLYTAACESEADLVDSQLRMFSEHSFSQPMPYFRSTIADAPINVARIAQGLNNYALTTLEKEVLAAVLGDLGPCAKLFLRQSLTDSGLQFDEGVNYEDNVFVYRAYLSAKRLVVIDETTYFYRKSATESNSQSCLSDEQSINDIAATYHSLEEIVQSVSNQHLRDLMATALENRALGLMNDHNVGPHMIERFSSLLRFDSEPYAAVVSKA